MSEVYFMYEGLIITCKCDLLSIQQEKNEIWNAYMLVHSDLLHDDISTDSACTHLHVWLMYKARQEPIFL